MTDTKKPQEQEVEKEMAVAKGLAVAEEMSEELSESHPFKPDKTDKTDKTDDEISKKSEDKENVEDKKIESIIEAGARTVALVDENVMMAMPELLETNPYTSEMTA
ncbi:hypothetical protein F8M41_024276 [Gigaspora margarita]|uniref:Uncharacterized protein n=1 Tax=Gigaspora margarita TaxID=4874 RepID=A0A8H4ABZ1_GIGMA|nr:hypothetical protein F8M41_024276 [Gigaspora margarita]